MKTLRKIALVALVGVIFGACSKSDGGGKTYPVDYITFDNSKSDTANITHDQDNGAIASLLSKFRRCLMYSNGSSGKATICYLDNSNSTLYSDGTTAAVLDGTYGDVMVYFPEYWYKYESVDDNTFRYYISEGSISGGVHVEASLVGAYKGYVDNTKLYSRSGVTPKDDATQANFITYSTTNRGKGYQIIDYEQHCTIAMMLYAKYKDRNLQDDSCLGAGSADSSTQTGLTNSLGNTDGVATWVNGLAIEGVFGGIYEFVQGVEISSNVWTITNPDKSTRTVKAYSTSSDWITAMAIEGYSDSSSDVGYSNSTTQYFDMVPTEASGGSETTYYADNYNCGSSGTYVLVRSCSSSSTNGGVAYSNAGNRSSVAFSPYGSRLAFRGTITVAASVSAYKALFVGN